VGALIGVLDDWDPAGREARLPHPRARGAIAGLDGVKAAREGAITSVTMETRKPPRGLAGAPYIEERHIDLDAIRRRR
jgi:aspartate dehydrogenase